jgi:Ca2+/Na+ antiporter
MSMSDNTQGVMSSLAAILVLFTALIDPRVSIVIAIAALTGLAVYGFRTRRPS